MIVVASLASQVEDVLLRTSDAYYRLILAVGPARLGKTVALAEIAIRSQLARLNVNLRISEKLLELTHAAESCPCGRHSRRHLSSEDGSDVVLLDNIELLFAAD